MKPKFTPIAMRCTQEQFEAVKCQLIKNRIELNVYYGFDEYPYLTTPLHNQNNIGNHSKFTLNNKSREIYETWNEKIFLEACGIEAEESFSITKEQIKELYELTGFDSKANNKWKEYFPEAFKEDKKELVVGKWYKSETAEGCTFVYFQGFNKKTYGIGHYGDWVDECKWFFNKFKQDNFGNNLELLKEATQEEVQESLTKEAVKRGFVDGVYLKSANSGEIYKILDYNFDLCSNTWLKMNGICIFKDGQWATIIPTITIKEAEEKLNKEFKIV